MIPRRLRSASPAYSRPRRQANVARAFWSLLTVVIIPLMVALQAHQDALGSAQSGPEVVVATDSHGIRYAIVDGRIYPESAATVTVMVAGPPQASASTAPSNTVSPSQTTSARPSYAAADTGGWAESTPFPWLYLLALALAVIGLALAPIVWSDALAGRVRRQ